MLFLFQNCSKMSFSASNSSVSPGSSITSVPSQPAQPGAPIITERTKILLPESTTQQNNQKVKVLLVVDNSATMTNSQENLSRNISTLLNELSKFDSEIQVVSTTYSTDDCPNNAKCRANALHQVEGSTRFDIFTDVNGVSRYGSISTTNTYPKPVTTFKINSTYTEAQKNLITSEISNKIKSLGVRGSDQERPFANTVLQSLSFFKKDDRALIFIITDEDDVAPFSPFVNYSSRYIESATVNTPYEGVSYYVSRAPGFTAFGSCRYYNEIGELVSSQYVPQGQNTQNTLAECNAFVTSQTNCSLSCTAFNDGYSGVGGLDGNSVQFVCDAIRSRLFPGESLSSCVASTNYTNTSINGRYSIGYHLGNTQQEIEAVQNSPTNLENLIISKFKSQVLNQLNEKYLISVATNTGVSGCGQAIGQTKDVFFKGIKKHFPSQNFVISSICDTAGTSASGIAKVAADFVNIVSTQYLIGLTDSEKIISAKIKLPTSANLITLNSGVDYKIVNGQFVLLNPAYYNFERIELLIDKK